MSANAKCLLIAAGAPEATFPGDPHGTHREWLQRGSAKGAAGALKGDRSVVIVGTERGMEVKLVPQDKPDCRLKQFASPA